MNVSYNLKPSKSLTILVILLIIFYLIYLILFSYAFHRSNNESARIAKERFYRTEINDTINRVEGIYKDNCNTSLWIKHYFMHFIVVNICNNTILKIIDTGTLIKKQPNTYNCTLKTAKGKTINIEINNEY